MDIDKEMEDHREVGIGETIDPDFMLKVDVEMDVLTSELLHLSLLDAEQLIAEIPLKNSCLIQPVYNSLVNYLSTAMQTEDAERHEKVLKLYCKLLIHLKTLGTENQFKVYFNEFKDNQFKNRSMLHMACQTYNTYLVREILIDTDVQKACELLLKENNVISTTTDYLTFEQFKRTIFVTELLDSFNYTHANNLLIDFSDICHLNNILEKLIFDESKPIVHDMLADQYYFFKLQKNKVSLQVEYFLCSKLVNYTYEYKNYLESITWTEVCERIDVILTYIKNVCDEYDKLSKEEPLERLLKKNIKFIYKLNFIRKNVNVINCLLDEFGLRKQYETVPFMEIEFFLTYFVDAERLAIESSWIFCAILNANHLIQYLGVFMTTLKLIHNTFIRQYKKKYGTIGFDGPNKCEIGTTTGSIDLETSYETRFMNNVLIVRPINMKSNKNYRTFYKTYDLLHDYISITYLETYIADAMLHNDKIDGVAIQRRLYKIGIIIKFLSYDLSQCLNSIFCNRMKFIFKQIINQKPHILKEKDNEIIKNDLQILAQSIKRLIPRIDANIILELYSDMYDKITDDKEYSKHKQMFTLFRFNNGGNADLPYHWGQNCITDKMDMIEIKKILRLYLKYPSTEQSLSLFQLDENLLKRDKTNIFESTAYTDLFFHLSYHLKFNANDAISTNEYIMKYANQLYADMENILCAADKPKYIEILKKLTHILLTILKSTTINSTIETRRKIFFHISCIFYSNGMKINEFIDQSDVELLFMYQSEVVKDRDDLESITMDDESIDESIDEDISNDVSIGDKLTDESNEQPLLIKRLRENCNQLQEHFNYYGIDENLWQHSTEVLRKITSNSSSTTQITEYYLLNIFKLLQKMKYNLTNKSFLTMANDNLYVMHSRELFKSLLHRTNEFSKISLYSDETFAYGFILISNALHIINNIDKICSEIQSNEFDHWNVIDQERNLVRMKNYRALQIARCAHNLSQIEFNEKIEMSIKSDDFQGFREFIMSHEQLKPRLLQLADFQNYTFYELMFQTNNMEHFSFINESNNLHLISSKILFFIAPSKQSIDKFDELCTIFKAVKKHLPYCNFESVINTLDKNMKSPMHIAIEHDNRAFIKYVLTVMTKNISIQAFSPTKFKEWNILKYILDLNKTDLLESMLFDMNANYDTEIWNEIIYLLCVYKQVNILQKLSDDENILTNINKAMLNNTMNNSKMNIIFKPIHGNACNKTIRHILKLLTGFGLDIHGDYGLLHSAIEHKYDEKSLNFLIRQFKANINQVNAANLLPIQFAIYHGNYLWYLKLLELHHKSDKNFNVQDYVNVNDLSVLILQYTNEQQFISDIIEILTEKCLLEVDKEGFIALQYAVEMNDLDIVQMLLKYKNHDKQLEFQNGYGLNALQYAIANDKDISIIKHLLYCSKRNINVTTSAGNSSLLHLACLKDYSNIPVIELLLVNSIDVRIISDKHQITAFETVWLSGGPIENFKIFFKYNANLINQSLPFLLKFVNNFKTIEFLFSLEKYYKKYLIENVKMVITLCIEKHINKILPFLYNQIKVFHEKRGTFELCMISIDDQFTFLINAISNQCIFSIEFIFNHIIRMSDTIKLDRWSNTKCVHGTSPGDQYTLTVGFIKEHKVFSMDIDQFLKVFIYALENEPTYANAIIPILIDNIHTLMDIKVIPSGVCYSGDIIQNIIEKLIRLKNFSLFQTIMDFLSDIIDNLDECLPQINFVFLKCLELRLYNFAMYFLDNFKIDILSRSNSTNLRYLPIHIAINDEKIYMIYKLLNYENKKYLPIQKISTDMNLCTILMMACEKGNLAIVKSLIEDCDCIDILYLKNQNNLSAPQLAVHCNSIDVVKYFMQLPTFSMKKSIKPGYQTFLHIAVRNQYQHLVEYFLQTMTQLNNENKNENIFNINAIDPIHYQTPLHVALETNNYAIMKLLIDAGARIDALTMIYQPPIALTNEKCKRTLKLTFQIFEEFQEVYAKINDSKENNLRDELNNLKRFFNNESSDEYEIKNFYNDKSYNGEKIGFWINAKRLSSDYSLLHLAILICCQPNIEHDNYAIIRLLFQNGANPNILNDNNETLLNTVVLQENSYDLVLIFLSYGAIFSSVDLTNCVDIKILNIFDIIANLFTCTLNELWANQWHNDDNEKKCLYTELSKYKDECLDFKRAILNAKGRNNKTIIDWVVKNNHPNANNLINIYLEKDDIISSESYYQRYNNYGCLIFELEMLSLMYKLEAYGHIKSISKSLYLRLLRDFGENSAYTLLLQCYNIDASSRLSAYDSADSSNSELSDDNSETDINNVSKRIQAVKLIYSKLNLYSESTILCNFLINSVIGRLILFHKDIEPKLQVDGIVHLRQALEHLNGNDDDHNHKKLIENLKSKFAFEICITNITLIREYMKHQRHLEAYRVLSNTIDKPIEFTHTYEWMQIIFKLHANFASNVYLCRQYRSEFLLITYNFYKMCMDTCKKHNIVCRNILQIANISYTDVHKGITPEHNKQYWLNTIRMYKENTIMYYLQARASYEIIIALLANGAIFSGTTIRNVFFHELEICHVHYMIKKLFMFIFDMFNYAEKNNEQLIIQLKTIDAEIFLATVNTKNVKNFNITQILLKNKSLDLFEKYTALLRERL